MNEPDDPHLIFEKAFGKAPEKGYDFKNIAIEVIDNEHFKGLDFGWLASGIGFGHVIISWGISDRIKLEFPAQFGFHCDTECMSREFIEALLIAAAPKLAELIVAQDLTNKNKEGENGETL